MSDCFYLLVTLYLFPFNFNFGGVFEGLNINCFAINSAIGLVAGGEWQISTKLIG